MGPALIVEPTVEIIACFEEGFVDIVTRNSSEVLSNFHWFHATNETKGHVVLFPDTFLPVIMINKKFFSGFVVNSTMFTININSILVD